MAILNPLSYFLKRNIKKDNSSKFWLIAITLLALGFSTKVSVAGGIVAKGDFESGSAGDWKTWQGRDKGRQFDIVKSPVRQGKYAAKFSVENRDKHGSNSGERSEVSNLLPTDIPFDNRDREGDNFYYAWSTYFPKDFPKIKRWAAIVQWHGQFGGTGSVTLGIKALENGGLYANLNAGKCGSDNFCERLKQFSILDNIKKGEWHDFVVRVKWSCSNDGELEVWHKMADEGSYDKKVSRSNLPTLKYTHSRCNKVYKKLGLYRSSGNTATHTVYHDGFVQGTSFDAVAGHAHKGKSSRTAVTEDESSSPSADIEVTTNDSSDTRNSDTRSGDTISQRNWELVFVNSEELSRENARAEKAFDGNPDTFWHSEWSENRPSHPHEIQIDLGSTYELEGFRYLPRQGHNNGRVKEYAFYVSTDGDRWGDAVAKGSFSRSDDAQTVLLRSPERARFIRFVALSEMGGKPISAVAELDVIGK